MSDPTDNAIAELNTLLRYKLVVVIPTLLVILLVVVGCILATLTETISHD